MMTETETIRDYLFKHAERFEFRQVLRILLATEGKPPRIRTSLYSHHSDKEVFALDTSGHQTAMTANLPCLTGPKGIMPHYFQDALRQVHIEQQQPGLFAFIEVFNRLILEKRFAVDQYASLPMMLEQLHHTEKWPRSFLNINGMPQSSDSAIAHQVLLRFHSILKVKTTYLGDLERVLSFYFNLPIKVRRGYLSRHKLCEDLCWHLGSKTKHLLGTGLILGRSITINEMPSTITINANSRGLWNKLKNNQQLIKRLYAHGSLLLNCTTLQCLAELPGHLLDAPALSTGKMRLGQYQILRPEHCKKNIQVRLT